MQKINQIKCKCGCGKKVSIYRGIFRQYRKGHYFKGKKFSKKHRKNLSSSQNPNNTRNWKGGTHTRNWYVYMYKPFHPNHPKAVRRYVGRATIILELFLERSL